MFTRILFYKREEYARIDGLVQARLPEIKSTDGLVANSRPTHNHTDTRGDEVASGAFLFSPRKNRDSAVCGIGGSKSK
jgi:hypothetical protein